MYILPRPPAVPPPPSSIYYTILSKLVLSCFLSGSLEDTVIKCDGNEEEKEDDNEDETGFVPDGPQVHVVHHLPC